MVLKAACLPRRYHSIMKLPEGITKLIGRKPQERKYILSLMLCVDSIAAGGWYLDDAGKLHVASTAHETVTQDSWDARIEAVDRAIATVEDGASVPRAIEKVVLGLPSVYLTPTGDIASDIRRQIKKLAQVLELTPIGFVALDQAIAYYLKREEGIPANVILLGVAGAKVAVSLFKIGNRIGQKIVDQEGVAKNIEEALKSFDGDDVLPSRMFLFGAEHDILDKLKSELLKHPWSTRVNFLHFPKIEIIPADLPVEAVCQAGAAELTSEVRGAEETKEEEVTLPTREKFVDEELEVVEKTAVPEKEEASEMLEAQEKGVEKEGEVEEIEKVSLEEEREAGKEDANVVMVPPEELGFRKEDIIERQTEVEKRQEEEGKEEEGGRGLRFNFFQRVKWPNLATIALPKLPSIPNVKGTPRTIVPLVLGIVALILLWWLYSFLMPRATVTVLVIPKTVKEEAIITVDPTATIVDSANKILPGVAQKKQVNGEKTIPVTGKKKVGDPAKGTVTIYNKSLAARTFQKGSTLVAKGLQFTLDDEVQVASASESIGSITFGKGNAAATAVTIGSEGNLPSGTEFTFKDVSSAVAVARNEAALTGGTSREVTVVSRADYDNLIKSLSEELLTRARAELAAGLGGAQKLIDATLKTEVSEKVFDQELDQEARELHGKVTLTISGLSYSEEDIKRLMADFVAQQVPSNYSLSDGRTVVTVVQAQTKKNRTVALSVKLESTILPKLDLEEVRRKLAGQRLTPAIEELKGLPGVAGAEVRFRWSLTQNRLPLNKRNISVSLAVQE